MIRTALMNVGKLFEDRNKRVLDLFEQRLIDLAVDSRAQLSTAEADMRDASRNSGSKVKIEKAMEEYEIRKATIKVVDGLIGDLNAIMQRVHLGG
ncbi:hypothetical protein SEA_LINETTI_58 [Gordonia phage Linetti]|nr:hypothetical protein SEA_LINETTI_58 [Gordonia phage Linetti]